jgi:hypothetical protein
MLLAFFGGALFVATRSKASMMPLPNQAIQPTASF